MFGRLLEKSLNVMAADFLKTIVLDLDPRRGTRPPLTSRWSTQWGLIYSQVLEGFVVLLVSCTHTLPNQLC